MKLLNTILLTAISSLLVISSASANLIVNGSFEDNNVNTNSWKTFLAADVAGWDGSNLEIWDQYQQFNAFDGTQYAELNSDAANGQAFSIFQSFATDIGSVYNVSFAYGARSNNNEAFLVDLLSANVNLFSKELTDHTVKSWTEFSFSFVATSTESSLMFTSVTPKTGTVGNFLDNVVVTTNTGGNTITTQVPEPQSLLLLSLALIGFTASRKKA
mgnify:CR=1 FL=1